MQHALATGLTASSASLLWTEQVAAQTPKKGGTLRIGQHDGNTNDTHDPGAYDSYAEIQMAHVYRSYLTEITAENSLGPDMANAWSASADASSWTFELNKEATFHDGRPFTSKDAIASLNHHRGENSKSAAAPLLADVTNVTADGDHIITIELSQGFADLPWILTDYHIAMLPAKEDGRVEWESGIGAGPYKLVNHEPGIASQFVRHEGWHREGAYFDAIDYTILNDANARQSALITGDVDVVSSIDLKTKTLLERNTDIQVDNIQSAAAITLPMFCDVAPFDNVDVRLALKYAINRDELIEKIFFGTASVGNDYHISPSMPYFPNLEQRAYDPDKAKFHLKKGGMDSLSVDLSTSETVFSGAVDMAVLYAEQAKAAGININIVREPKDGYYSNVWLTKPFVASKWGARPTPDNIFTLVYKAGAAWNESHWANDRFNEILLQAKAEIDDSLRAEMYREMSELAKDDGGSILPVFQNFVYARRSNVQHGEHVSGAWELDGGRAAQRWWFV